MDSKDSPPLVLPEEGCAIPCKVILHLETLVPKGSKILVVHRIVVRLCSIAVAAGVDEKKWVCKPADVLRAVDAHEETAGQGKGELLQQGGRP
ncbi:hypothetical protein CRG98_003342 [Punica granatum]|uniref:Uncharacterized protein n=1 Tax=Punica granatum TaxID=22663 RepID=A0A2I0L685_PUNGR|nr:hypothetical protein CRG98_003342 [Punica granatum]